MLVRGEAEVRRLETQRRVVRHHARGSRESLTECRTDDAIVGFGRIETVLDEKMALNSVDLDVDRGTLAHGGRRSQRTPCLQANFLELPQGRSGSATHVVGTTLESVQLFDHRERHDDVATGIRVQAVRVGDQNRRVEHHTRRGECVCFGVRSAAGARAPSSLR